MEKFTTKLKNKKVKIQTPTENDIIVYDSEDLKIIKNDKWDCEFVDEKDTVACLVYLKNEDCIIMRAEPIPSWRYKHKNKIQKLPDRYLTLISGTIEHGETPQQALRRELYEEAGIVLPAVYDFNIEGPFFKTKGTTSQYYTCLLVIDYNEYKFVKAPGDGSKIENMSKIIKVKWHDIDKIIINDIITQYLITKLKLEQKILF